MAQSSITMRLLFVLNADWFFVSHRLRLARACRDKGYEVHVAAGESMARAAIEKEGFRFHPVPMDRGGTNPFADLKTLTRLFALYREVAPDLVHHVTIKPVLYGGLVARILGIPAVHAVSGLGYVFIETPEDGLGKRGLRAALRQAYRLVFSSKRCRVIFQNESDRGEFVGGGLAREASCRLVPGSGVDPEVFSPGPLPEAPLVLFPARLLRDKGLFEFVEAARSVKRSNPSVRFVLAGRLDPGNPACVSEETVRAWVGEQTVEWWAGLEHSAMPSAYRQASLVVLPSYREGLPLSLVEAAACGRATITTDVPGCRDAIRPGVTGWLVPVRDARALEMTIRQALSDRARLQEFGENGVTWAARRFSARAIHEQILQIYAELS